MNDSDKTTKTEKIEDYAKYFSKVSLPFNNQKQSAFLGYLFDHSNGLYKHYAVLMDSTWFADPDHGAIFKAIQHYYNKFNRVYSHLEIQESNFLAAKDAESTRRLKSKIDISIENKSQFGFEGLVAELEDWKNAKILETTFTEGAQKFNQQDFAGASESLKDAIKIYNETSFTKTNVVKLSDFTSLIEGMSSKKSVYFGLKALDDVLFEGSEGGGLKTGDQTLLIGASNQGKSSVMITTMMTNALRGKHGLFLTLEGVPADLSQKQFRCFLSLISIADVQRIYGVEGKGAEMILRTLRHAGSKQSELLRMLSDEKYKGLLSKASEYIDNFITYIPYNKPGMEIEDLIPVIERQAEEKKDSTGRNYDICVFDYLGIASTRKASKGRMDVRHILDYVYQTGVQLALQHDWHSLTAIQTNRSGAKINNRTTNEDRLIELTDVAEGWGPITTCSTAISINRPPEAQRLNWTVFKLCKSRSSRVGLVVAATSDYSRCVAFSDGSEYGSISYYGDRQDVHALEDKLMPGVNRMLTTEEELGIFSEKEATEESA